jgi:hypothetical protein
MIALYAAKAFGFLRSLPWQLWLVVAVLATGWFWGNHRYNEGVEDAEARYAAAAAKAVVQARDAERAAQQTYEAERPAREAETDELRRRADAAPDGGEAGPKTRAVLEGLRR